MAVGLKYPENIKPVRGVRLSSTSAGLYENPRDDLVLIEFSKDSEVACVFTKNLFCAAPVIVAKSHLSDTSPLYCLINAGNANAGTGDSGLSDAKLCCSSLAESAHCRVEAILPFSTGVIGQALATGKIISSLPKLLKSLDNNWTQAAAAIMTTDTVPKAISKQISIGDEIITITGIAKGSGMIRPDMATMLAYVATDAKMKQADIDLLLNELVNNSFNRITVDGDTSTNDACLLVATGESNVEIDSLDSDSGFLFKKALSDVFLHLAQSIIRDGEGATKFVTVSIEGGNSENDCLQLAYCIAHSPLVKTALFASDPNWGRILAAIGRSGLKDLNVNKVDVFLDDICIVRQGCIANEYTEEAGQKIMQQEEITIKVLLHRGKENAEIWTSDLSYDYVNINAEYRT